MNVMTFRFALRFSSGPECVTFPLNPVQSRRRILLDGLDPSANQRGPWRCGFRDKGTPVVCTRIR